MGLEDTTFLFLKHFFNHLNGSINSLFERVDFGIHLFQRSKNVNKNKQTNREMIEIPSFLFHISNTRRYQSQLPFHFLFQDTLLRHKRNHSITRLSSSPNPITYSFCASSSSPILSPICRIRRADEVNSRSVSFCRSKRAYPNIQPFFSVILPHRYISIHTRSSWYVPKERVGNGGRDTQREKERIQHPRKNSKTKPDFVVVAGERDFEPRPPKILQIEEVQWFHQREDHHLPPHTSDQAISTTQ